MNSEKPLLLSKESMKYAGRKNNIFGKDIGLNFKYSGHHAIPLNDSY